MTTTLLIKLLSASVIFCSEYVDPEQFDLHSCVSRIMTCVDNERTLKDNKIEKEWEYCQDWIAF